MIVLFKITCQELSLHRNLRDVGLDPSRVDKIITKKRVFAKQ